MSASALVLPIPVEVPGLESVIPNVEDGSLVLLEGGPDPAKSFMARRLARSALAGGRRVHIVTSRDAEDVEVDGAIVHEAMAWKDLGPVRVDGDVVIDSFSFLALDAPDEELAKRLREWRRQANAGRHAVILVSEHGMLGPRQETIAAHMADAILEFRRREREDSVRPYLQVPRWFGGRTDPRNYYLTFTGDEMMVDTRTRLV